MVSFPAVVAGVWRMEVQRCAGTWRPAAGRAPSPAGDLARAGGGAFLLQAPETRVRPRARMRAVRTVAGPTGERRPLLPSLGGRVRSARRGVGGESAGCTDDDMEKRPPSEHSERLRSSGRYTADRAFR